MPLVTARKETEEKYQPQSPAGLWAGQELFGRAANIFPVVLISFGSQFLLLSVGKPLSLTSSKPKIDQISPVVYSGGLSRPKSCNFCLNFFQTLKLWESS